MISTIQVAVPNTSVKLCDVPPGVGSVTVTVGAASTTIVYIGAGATTATTNGVPVVGGASVTIPLYAGSKGTVLSAVGSVAGPTPVGVLISTAQ